MNNIGTQNIETNRLILRKFEYSEYVGRLYYSMLKDEFDKVKKND